MLLFEFSQVNKFEAVHAV